jgi:predicted esterase
MKANLLSVSLLIHVALTLQAQPQTNAAAAGQAAWRQGVFTDLPAALGNAAKQQGRVAVAFSTDPLDDHSLIAQVYGAKEVRDWAYSNNITLALIEFPNAETSGFAAAKADFVEVTRQNKVAGSRTWLFFNANGKPIGRLCKEDVVRANENGVFTNKCEPDQWLRQAEIALQGHRPAPLPQPANAQAGWYARFGGKGWTGRRTIKGDEGAMNYTLFVPQGLVEEKKYPLVIWLHGGGRFDGNEIADDDAVHLSVAASRADAPAFVLIPSAIGGQNWTGAPGVGSSSEQITEPSPTMKLIARLIQTLPRSYAIDTNKVIVMGESGGAFGCWGLLQFYPDRFCGAVINSGGADPAKTSGLGKQRIWIIHGAKDEIVPVYRSEEMFEAVTKFRGQEPLVRPDGDWIKAADAADTIRFWKHSQCGHVPSFDYEAALDWVLHRQRTISTRRPAAFKDVSFGEFSEC